MNKIIKLGFIISILCFMLIIPVIVIGIIEESVLICSILAFLYLISGVTLFRITYKWLIIKNRKSNRWCKMPSAEELEYVNDAIDLIKKVDNNIVISQISVYKIRFMTRGWFYYDNNTEELCIFIPFKNFLLIGGKNLCFVAVLHEVLHSQNLRNNLMIFNRKFLEGLNQFLTIWLIDNYSKKYKIRKNKTVTLRFMSHYFYITIFLLENVVYLSEVRMVKEIIEKSNIDIKDMFINYINFKPEFFRSFVPSKYFEKQ